jgi:hypothetical protein
MQNKGPTKMGLSTQIENEGLNLGAAAGVTLRHGIK